MKHAKYIVFVIALVVVLLVGLVKTSKPQVVDKPVSSQQFCYIWNTEAGDKATLKFIITGTGDSANGSFTFLPAEKDSKAGDFSGIISQDSEWSRTIHDILNATGEGVNNKEEILIKIWDTTASVGFGEMKDRGDGVYVYADPSTISYAPTLQETNCDDSAMQ